MVDSKENNKLDLGVKGLKNNSAVLHTFLLKRNYMLVTLRVRGLTRSVSITKTNNQRNIRIILHNTEK